MPTVRHTDTDRPTVRGAPAARLPVYPAREDSLLLLPYAAVLRGSSFLEVGCGAGEVALAAARAGARVVATDRNPHALRLVRARAAAERLEVALVRTDLARGLGRFDRVVFNPPYLPTLPGERDPDPWHNLALDGGPDGTGPTVRWAGSLAEHLRPGGDGYSVVSSLEASAPLAGAAERWHRLGGTVTRVEGRTIGGERLEVWRWSAPVGEPGPPEAPGAARPPAVPRSP